MRWDTLVEFWVVRLKADAALESVLGAKDRIYPAQASRAVGIPSVEYLIISDREDELFNPIGVQVDIFAKGTKKAAQIERRIRTLTHSDVAQDLGGERVWMRYQNSQSLPYPADPGSVHKVLEFEFEAIREKYATL